MYCDTIWILCDIEYIFDIRRRCCHGLLCKIHPLSNIEKVIPVFAHEVGGSQHESPEENGYFKSGQKEKMDKWNTNSKINHSSRVCIWLISRSLILSYFLYHIHIKLEQIAIWGLCWCSVIQIWSRLARPNSKLQLDSTWDQCKKTTVYLSKEIHERDPFDRLRKNK